MPKKENSQVKKPPLANYARYTGIAFQMIVVLLLGVWGGFRLDDYLSTMPLFTVLFTLLAVVFAIIMVIREFVGKSKK